MRMTPHRLPRDASDDDLRTWLTAPEATSATMTVHVPHARALTEEGWWMMQRFRDPGVSLLAFCDLQLVVCPRCAQAARVIPREPAEAAWSAPRRLVCPRCGLLKEWAGGGILLGGHHPQDSYFRLPLWLQTPVGRHVLWAYNGQHVTLMTHYVAAQLRERRPSPQGWWHNSSLITRLPRWMATRQARHPMLKALARLAARAADVGEPKSRA